MKKTLMILGLLVITSGCSISTTNMENIIIYTSTYPIEYITNELYKEHSRIFSIYPNEVVELSDKLLTDYSNGDLFVYNGLSEEKNYAVDMINKNKNLMIVDAAMGMEYTYGVEELWINPSNFLMLSQNIKNGFKEYITNSYLINEIEDNYDEIKLQVSVIDAEFKLMAENATSKNLVVSNDVFLFLEKYGINVVSIDPDTELLDKRTSTAQGLIDSKDIKYILTLSGETLDESIETFIEENELEPIVFHSLTTISSDEEDNDEDYISIMYNNIDELKKELYE
jgi:zinc transport system substrate-binding protein